MAKMLELLKQKLAALYFFLEEKYYRVMDVLNDKLKIPVYKYYVNPIESRGVPSFPVTIAIFIIVVILLLLLLFGGAPSEESKLTVIVKSKGFLLDNAKILVLDGGNEIASKETIVGKALFTGLPLKHLLIKASKPNFSPASKEIDFTKQKTLTLELGCNTAACLEELSKLQGASVMPTPVFPTASIQPWDKDPDEETSKARLIVQVHSAANSSVRPNAAVTVYDANSDVSVGESATTKGDAVFQDLEVGMKVYVMIEAEGYIPYDGSKKTVSIKKGSNTISVKIFPFITCLPTDSTCKTNFATSLITVREAEDETPVASAKVSIYNASNPGAPLYKDKTTDKNGTFKANLSAEGEYYAVVSKTNYFTEASGHFKAGDNVTVFLTKKTPETTANLTANVFDLDGEGVASASVAVFSLNATGQTVKLGEKNTGNKNYAVFQELRRGITVRVNASKTSQFGATELNLTEAENNATVSITLLNATIIARAKNLFTGKAIAGVEFKAFKNGVLLASCVTGGADNTCVLAVNAKKLLEVNASKAGFQPNPWSTTLTLQPEQVYELNALMASEEDLSDVQVFPSDPFLTDAFTQEPVSKLKLGHSYTVRFQLVSKTNADLQSSGMHLRLEPFGNAFITGNSPSAPQQLAAVSDETKSGCGGLENVDYASGKEYSWVDLTWGGAKSYVVAINFTVSLDAELDEETKTGVLLFKHRAFGKKNDGTYVRNPFDPNLGTQPDAPLESGCNAAANLNETMLVNPGATCGKGFCAYLRFHQFDKEGNEGFEAQNNSPLYAFYKIEVFQPLDDYTRLLYAVNSQFLQVYNVSVPIPADGGFECGAGKQNIFDPQWLSGAKAVAINFSNLTKCFNYPPLNWPYEFSGIVYGKTIQTSGNVPVVLSIASAPSQSEVSENNELNHSTWFSISAGEARKPVEITFKLKQSGYVELKGVSETRQLDSEAFMKDNWASCAEDAYSYCASNASNPDYKPEAYSCSKYVRNPQTDAYAFQTLAGVPGSYAGFSAFAIEATGPDYEVPQDSKNKPIELTFTVKAGESVYNGVLRLEIPEKWPEWGVNPNDLYYYPKGCAFENASVDYPEPMLDPLLGNDEIQHPNRSKMWRCTADSPTGAPENAQALRSFVQNQLYNPDDCRQFMKLTSVEFNNVNYPVDSAKSFVEIPVGDLQKGSVLSGKATLIPLVPEGKSKYGWRSGVTAVFTGSFSKDFLEPVTARKSEYVGRYCDTIPERECVFENITSTDMCFLFVHVNYTDEKGLRVLLNADENVAFADVQMAGMYKCNGINFNPNGLTPAGWLVVSVESPKTLTVKINTDESENPDAVGCYSSAPLNADGSVGSWSPGLSGFTRPGFNVVKYDSNACPSDYKMFGNRIPETSLEMNITASGVTDPKKNSVAVTLKGGIENYVKKRYMGFFIAPVATTFLHNSDGSVDKSYGAPQLWAVINNAQWGSRKIVVKMTGGSGSIASESASTKLSYGDYDTNELLEKVSKLSKASYAMPGDGVLPPGDLDCSPGDECGPGSGNVCPQGQTCDYTLCVCEGAEPTSTPTPGGKVGIPPKSEVKELSFEFDKPGVQYFTYAPTPGSKLAFYEEVEGELKEITGTKGLLSVVEGTYASPYNFWAEYKNYASDRTPDGFVATLGNDVYDQKKFDLFAENIGMKGGNVANLVHSKIMGKLSFKSWGKNYGPYSPITWLRPDGELKADYFQPLNVFTGFKQKSPLDGKTEDCSENAKYKNQGVFTLHYAVEGDKKAGQGELTAEVVHVTKDKQFGYACSKEASAWDDVELCAPAYADFSRFGACWNTFNSDGFSESKTWPGFSLSQANFVGRFTGGTLIPGGGDNVVVSPGGFIVLARGGNVGDQGKGACITTDKYGSVLTQPDFAQCYVKNANVVFELWYPDGTIHPPKDIAYLMDSNPDLYAKLASGPCPTCKWTDNNQLCDCEGGDSGLPACDSREAGTKAAASSFGLCNNHYWELTADASSVWWEAGVNCEGVGEQKFWSDVATLALGNCVKQETVQALDCENNLNCLTSTKTYSGNKVLGAQLKFECIDGPAMSTGIEQSDVEPLACSFAAPDGQGNLKVLWGTRNPGAAPATHKCFKNTPGACAPCFYNDLNSKQCVQTAGEVNTDDDYQFNNAKFLMCYDSACGGGSDCIINSDCSQPE